MKKYKALIIVPYKARDFAGYALLAYHLKEKYGIESVLTNAYLVPYKIMINSPDVFVIDHATWEFKKDELKFAQDLGIKTLMLPTEGLNIDREDLLRSVGVHHNAQKYIDNFFAWGQFHNDNIVDAGILPQEKVQITGCPRFDFYAPQFTQGGYYRSKIDFLREIGAKNISGNIVLWATNTPYVGWPREEVIRRYVSRSDYTEERMNEVLDESDLQFSRHIETIRFLARKNPEITFIIKTHPAESVGHYFDHIEGIENIHLLYNIPIAEVLVHSDILLQRNCTTATEAWMFRKPVIQMEIPEYRHKSYPYHLQGNDVVVSHEEIDSKIHAYLSGQKIPESILNYRTNYLRDYYHSIDGESAMRVADGIFSMVTSDSYDNERKNSLVEFAYKKWKAAEDKRLINKIKDLIGIDRNTSLRFLKKYKNRKKVDRSAEGEVEITKEMVKDFFEVLKVVYKKNANKKNGDSGRGVEHTGEKDTSSDYTSLNSVSQSFIPH